MDTFWQARLEWQPTNVYSSVGPKRADPNKAHRSIRPANGHFRAMESGTIAYVSDLGRRESASEPKVCTPEPYIQKRLPNFHTNVSTWSYPYPEDPRQLMNGGVQGTRHRTGLKYSLEWGTRQRIAHACSPLREECVVWRDLPMTQAVSWSSVNPPQQMCRPQSSLMIHGALCHVYCSHDAGSMYILQC